MKSKLRFGRQAESGLEGLSVLSNNVKQQQITPILYQTFSAFITDFDSLHRHNHPKCRQGCASFTNEKTEGHREAS